MRVQIVSDIHLDEEKGYNVRNCVRNDFNADVLVIAGDIAHGYFYNSYEKCKRKIVEGTMNYFKKKWNKVVISYGNHDFYHGTLPNYYGHVQIINDVFFVCTPLFSNIPSNKWIHEETKEYVFPDLIYMFNSDYSGDLRCKEYVDYHFKCVKWLDDSLSKIPDFEKVIVVTHHLPLKECISLTHVGDSMNYFFANQLDDLIKKHDLKIQYWIHGHSHSFHKMEKYGVKFIRNPVGYLGELDNCRYSNYVIDI